MTTKLWILGGEGGSPGAPFYQGEKAQIPWVIEFPWATSVSVSDSDIVVYRSGVDVTSTVMPSGSHSASGNRLTMKPLKNLVGGSTYIISISPTVDGVKDEWFMKLVAVKSKTGEMA